MLLVDSHWGAHCHLWRRLRGALASKFRPFSFERGAEAFLIPYRVRQGFALAIVLSSPSSPSSKKAENENASQDEADDSTR